MKSGPISISFCINDKYSQHLAVVIASFLHNNPQYDFIFHVLHRNVSIENQAKISELCHFGSSDRSVKIVFHEIDSGRFAEFPIPAALEHVTREMYYRFILPDVLVDEARTIYIDVDVLCVADILPLWQWELGDKLVGAVSEGADGEMKKKLLGLDGPEPYYYSGMLVMDLAALRAGEYSRKLMSATLEMADKISWPDQDVMNVVLRGKIADVPMIWDEVANYNPFRKDVKIWHFPGAVRKPWCPIWKNRGRFPYARYLRMSPYRDNFAAFVWANIKGFFYFKYVKKGVERTLVCGVLVCKREKRSV